MLRTGEYGGALQAKRSKRRPKRECSVRGTDFASEFFKAVKHELFNLQQFEILL
jgi:hypothetical protein